MLYPLHAYLGGSLKLALFKFTFWGSTRNKSESDVVASWVLCSCCEEVKVGFWRVHCVEELSPIWARGHHWTASSRTAPRSDLERQASSSRSHAWEQKHLLLTGRRGSGDSEVTGVFKVKPQSSGSYETPEICHGEEDNLRGNACTWGRGIESCGFCELSPMPSGPSAMQEGHLSCPWSCEYSPSTPGGNCRSYLDCRQWPYVFCCHLRKIKKQSLWQCFCMGWQLWSSKTHKETVSHLM